MILRTILFAFLVSILYISCESQIQHAKTENVRVYGNCGMCKKRIEKAGNVSGIAKVSWDADSEIAQITYNSQQTSTDEILQRIAGVGHDSDTFKAEDAVYADLHSCCQYARPER